MLHTPNHDYRILDAQGAADYLAAHPALAAHLGGTPGEWTCRDVADGNLNSVFLIDGPQGGLCVKQSLPYVRVFGEGWPMDINRARFEHAYASRVAPHVGTLAPRIHHFDETQFITVMEKLEPHIILRNAMLAGRRLPRAVADVAEYAARTAFHTSDLAVPFERKFADAGVFSGNLALQRITVDLVFTDPYVESGRNRVLSPHLDAWAASLREDSALKAAVARHRLAYLSKAQSVLHGDLHTGSVMVTPDDTRIIDGEFALLGPTGFDTGTFIAHYVMAWFARSAHEGSSQENASFRAALADDIVEFWNVFATRFIHLWQEWDGENDGTPRTHFTSGTDRQALDAFRRSYVDEILADTVAFMGVEIIRRIIGFAQLADFTTIADEPARARAMAGALSFARTVLLNPGRFRDVATLVGALLEHERADAGDPQATGNV
ncbi:S-methyl-5-thioribose kinase [Rhizobium puerariae]|uniref:S-methyl-5-thioribose kinase n=1 Tax=Rhizobium puerariae TaxID=1585791 RepID=A0ABV6AE23_9HYPH